MQGWEAIYTLSVWRPQPSNTNLQKERRESENSNKQNGSEQLRPLKKYWPCYENLPVPHHWMGDDRSTETLWGKKSPMVLRGSAPRRHISLPISFVIFILLVQTHLSGTVFLKSWTPRSNFLWALCIQTGWRKRNNFLCKRITRE